jgi:hypothetical protein
MRRIYRYEIPIDDKDHELTLSGPIIHVAARSMDHVELWAEHDDNAPGERRTFRVVGTGHTIPPGFTHVATVFVRSNPPLVWHLMEDTDDVMRDS